MPTYTPIIPNGGSNGRMIKIAATSSPGTLLHTVHATAIEEVYLWVVNSDGTARKVTVQLGGTTSPDDLIEQTIQPESGLILLVPGVRLTGGVEVRAFAASANLLLAALNINRIT